MNTDEEEKGSVKKSRGEKLIKKQGKAQKKKGSENQANY